MKKILIFAIVTILLIFGYNKYQDYRRFNGPQTNYEINPNIDVNYHDKSILFNYQNAITSLNSFIKMQWSAHRIDVINPEKDTQQIQLAVNTYAQKAAEIAYYESILNQSTKLKAKGLNNEDIRIFEETGLTVKTYDEQKQKQKSAQRIRNSFNNKTIHMGEKSPLIFEIQKILNKNGFNIKNDGVFQNETSLAIKAFETKHNLLPDGKIDIISLEYLLENN